MVIDLGSSTGGGGAPRPWDYRKTAVPKRTYSGRVVYDRRRIHSFTPRDLERISAKVLQNPELDRSWYDRIVETFKRMAMSMLDVILNFFGVEGMTEAVFNFIYALVDRVVRVLGLDDLNRFAEQVIYHLASRSGLIVEVKRPPK